MGALLAVAAAAFAYVFWFAGGSGEPSTELTVPELAPTTSAPGTTAGTADPPSSTEASSGAATFVIDQTRSSARFEIDEELRGNPNHVVGTTDQVAGQVRVDSDDLSTAEFSEIVVNARTLATDSERRDRAIRGPVILNSAADEFELITLQVTSVDGLTGSAAVGEVIDFTLVGDLTVKGSTQSVSFDVSVTMTGDDTIEGSAVADVTRDQFGIGIPSVPGVANVTDEVLIGLDFVAVAG